MSRQNLNLRRDWSHRLAASTNSIQKELKNEAACEILKAINASTRPVEDGYFCIGATRDVLNLAQAYRVLMD